MTQKRYFFVHLLIFACLCTMFAVAGISAYQDFLRVEGLEASGPGARGAAGTAPALSGGGILALSGAMGTRYGDDAGATSPGRTTR